MSEGKRERGKEKLTHNLSGNERQGEKKSVIEREQDRVRERETNVVQLKTLGKKFRGQIRNFIQIHSFSRSNLNRYRIRLL